MQPVWLFVCMAPITAFLFLYQCWWITRKKVKEEAHGNGVFTAFTFIYIAGTLLLLIIGG